MNISLYSPTMERIAIIGGGYISCAWSEGYNTVQPFTLELIATDEYKKKVKPDCYVGRDDRKTLMVLKTVRTKNGRIIASGKQATRCLDDVAFRGRIPAGSNITQSIKSAYDGTEGFERWRVAASSLPDTYGHTISNKTIADLLLIMCKDSDIGYRAVRNNGFINLEFYKPEPVENRILREAYGSLRIEAITLSTEKLKNHAVILGEGEDDDRFTVELDIRSDTSVQKRSMIIDARDIQREKNDKGVQESDESYTERLIARGYERLLEQTSTWECAMEPLPEEFGKLYDLGDIVTALLPDYGIRLRARIVRFTQNSKDNKTDTTMEIGTITVTR